MKTWLRFRLWWELTQFRWLAWRYRRLGQKLPTQRARIDAVLRQFPPPPAPSVSEEAHSLPMPVVRLSTRRAGTGRNR